MSGSTRGPASETTLHAVDDLGASPDGATPLRLSDPRIGPDTTVVFPDGEFVLSGTAAVGGGSLLFRAADGASPTLVAPSGYNQYCINARCRRFAFRGIDVDVSAGVTGLRVKADAFEIANVTVRGRGTFPAPDVTNCFELAVTHPDGRGVVRNVTALKGSTWARYKGGDGRVWAWVGPDHVGELRVRNCRVEEFGNNGIYGSAAPGPIVVEDSAFWNNNVASLRFGSDGSTVRNTVVGVDAGRYTGPRESNHESTAFFMRGIWIEAKDAAVGSPGRVTVADSTVVVRDAPTGRKAIAVRPNAGALTVSEGTMIDVRGDTDTPAVEAARPSAIGPPNNVVHPKPEPPYDVDLDTVRISGDAAGSAAVSVVGRDVTARRTVVAFADVRDGFRVVDADCALVDCHVTVGGEPVVLRRSDGTLVTELEALDGDADTGGPRLIRRNLSTRTSAVEWHDLVVGSRARSDAEPVRITLAGAPRRGEPLGYSLVAESGASFYPDENATDAIGGTVSGEVPPDGRTTYYLRGALASASFDGAGSVELDGEPVRLSRLADETRRRAYGSDGAVEALWELL